ncbi:MAG TPA: Gfo/Idh/MocA family oxidoreductase, partial [Balneolaceae bacterium]|nr:Gfo/Idh/MocA family oxidoreductase [Balneolaceae bacterium]
MKKNNQQSSDDRDNSVNSKLSRRDFLKNTSLATAGFYIVPRHVLGGTGYTAPSDTLYIAAVGTGGEGRSDINHFAKSGNAKIAYLCDVDDRRSAGARKAFPDAHYYNDWRKIFDKESGNFDAVSVSIPDHNHAIVALNAMKRGKHVYVQKPLTHDIYETSILVKAAQKYNVVTQMGDQGASSDGIRTMKEWRDAGIIGDIKEAWCWTNRPIWPQGIPWPTHHEKVPKGLKWNLWLGTAQDADYHEAFVPQRWRGFWPFGTGSVGDMACHIVGPVFKVVKGLTFPDEVSTSVSTVVKEPKRRTNWGIEVNYTKSAPVSSSSHLKFTLDNGKEFKVHWMDGGIQPERPDELEPDQVMGNGGNGALFIGTDGKFMCSTYGHNPRLLPVSMTNEVKVPKKYPRVPNGSEGHWKQWVDAAIAGDESMCDSPFVGYAEHLVPSVLLVNLAIRSFQYQEPRKNKNGKVT